MPAARSVSENRRAEADRLDIDGFGFQSSDPRTLVLLQCTFIEALAGEVFGKQQKEIVVFAREQGEFVANLVSANLEDVMVLSSIDAQLGTSEFELSRLTPEPISFARFPRVKEVFAALECKLTEIWRPRSLTNPENAPFVVTGEVIDVHIDERVLTNGLIDIAKVRPVSRLGYFDYLVTKETFAKFRPQWVSTSEG